MSTKAHKGTLAETYLSKIAALDEEMPSFGSNNINISPFPSPKRQQHARLSPIKSHDLSANFPSLQPSTSPIRSNERPVSTVKSLIKAKETETIENDAINFTPKPDTTQVNENSKKSVFISKNHINLSPPSYIPKLEQNPHPKDDKLSKSEMGRMGKINTTMSASPSLKTLLIAKVQPSSENSVAMKSWIDSNRDNLKLASFVCRLLEIKRWIEKVLGESIGLEDYNIDKFPDYLVNGVLICRIAQKFDPKLIPKIWTCDGNNKFGNTPEIYLLKKRDFKYIQNIGQFLSFTSKVKLPILFSFETNDLYEMADIPKVIGCLHALACMMEIASGAPTVTKIEKMELCSLSDKFFNIDKLKSINYRVGRNLPGKYLSGFDEAVRVNLGDDIRNLELVSIDSSKMEPTISEQTKIIDKVIPPTKVKSNTSTISGTSTILLDDTITPTTSVKHLEEAKRARAFFNAPISRSTTLPKLDSMTAIHDKYKYLLGEDERALLSGSSLSHFKASETITDIDEDQIVKFQSLSRGYLLRFDMFVNKFMLKNNSHDIIKFQSICRGVLERSKLIGGHISTIKSSESFYSSSQLMKTLYRNKTKYSESLDTQIQLKENESFIIKLQSIARGNISRNRQWEIKKFLLKNYKVIVDLQSRSRSRLLRSSLTNGHHRKSIKVKRKPPPGIICAEVEEDGGLFESFNKASKQTVKEFEEPLTPLRSTSHVIPRSELKKMNAKLEPNLPLTESQIDDLRQTSMSLSPDKSRVVSKLHHSPTKKKLNRFLPDSRIPSTETTLIFKPRTSSLAVNVSEEQSKELNEYSETVAKLQAHLRGVYIRSEVKFIHHHISKHSNKLTKLVSIYRGVETRFEIDSIRLDLKDEEGSVIQLQSNIRRYLVQKKIKDREQWFLRPDNLKKITKLQAFIRGFRDQRNYKMLIEEFNPPFRAIQKFSNLLGGVECEKVIDDNLNVMSKKEECKLERIKLNKSIQKLKEVRLKYDILKSNGLKFKDIKIINVDDPDETHVDDLNLSSIGKDILKYAKEEENKLIEESSIGVSMQRKERDLVDLYGTLFWTLQTQLKYWTDVIIELTKGEVEVQFSHGHLEDWVLKCFNFNEFNDSIENSREEGEIIGIILNVVKYLIGSLSTNDFKLEIKDRRDLKYDNVKLWELILMSYTNLSQQRSYTKDNFGGMVFLITGDDEAWFECDPDVIKVELELDESYLDSIDIPEVKSQYVKNLTSLKTNTLEVLHNLENKIEEIPIYLRCLLKEIFQAVKSKYPTVSESYWYGFIGSILMKSYLLPMFLTPSNYSIDIYSLSEDYEDIEKVQRNLDLISMMLLQSVLMKPFSGSQCPYLIPLNSFISGNSENIKTLLDKIINVNDIHQTYQRVKMTQMGSKLKIKVDDLIELTNIWGQFREQFFDDDKGPLFEALSRLAQYDNISRKPQGDSYGFIEFPLLETVKTGISDEVQLKAIWLELKRYLTYILQVQKGENLIEVLLAGIEPADEAKFLQLIKKERVMLKERGVKAENEIYRLPYPLVKERAISLINELEDLGVVDFKDGYQTILNELAKDIKTKKIQRREIESETGVIVDILTELKRKTVTYERKASDYNSDIDRQLNVMMKSKNGGGSSGSSNIGKKKLFFKKLFRSSIGKTKPNEANFSMRQLYDNGVIKEKTRGSLEVRCDKGQVIFELNGGMRPFTISLDDLIHWQYDKEYINILGLRVDALRLSQLVIKQFYCS